nr:hypothetical protein [uncultured Roseococcus sp.]
MFRFVALVGSVLVAAVPAHAQVATYCAGALQAVQFHTQPDPDGTGWAVHSVRLRNRSGRDQSFSIVVTAPFLGRPTPRLRHLPPGAMVVVPLGQQVIQPNQTPLRGNELAEVVRVTCR